MTASDFAAIVRDLRAAGVYYEPADEIDRLPFLVRHQTSLYTTIGRLCDRVDTAPDHRQFVLMLKLRVRAVAALRWIEAIGARSIWAKRGWFKGCAP